MGIRRWVADADQAALLAFDRVKEGVPDEEIVRELRSLPGSKVALRLAARIGTRGTDWSAARVRAVLTAASTGAPIVPATADELAAYQQQRELLEMPRDEAFEFLAARLPALRDLQRRAQQTLPPMPFLVPGGPPTGPDGPHFSAFVALRQEAASLVGPTSGQTDRLLGSDTALRVVSHALLAAGGIAPLGE
ncbi:MAG TPA: hypothetical protein VHX15_08415 [Frankiaceae bacterium]|jgi:hypothetical protein|nr:hypothetical protein [Frankiaceae bacterium]